MKRIILFSMVIVGCFLFTSFIGYRNGESAKRKAIEEQNQIPDAVAKILAKSCYDCHANPGKEKALIFLNLSDWNKLSLKKQAAEASRICRMVTNEKMPPLDYLDKNPGKALTETDIKTLCNWSDSLQKSKN